MSDANDSKPQEDLAFEPPKLVVLGSVEEVTANFLGEGSDAEGGTS